VPDGCNCRSSPLKHSAPPNPLAGFKGGTSRREKEKGKGKGARGKGEEEK